MYRFREGTFHQGSYRVDLNFEGDLPRAFEKTADSALIGGVADLEMMLIPEIRDLAQAPVLGRPRRCRLNHEYSLRSPDHFVRVGFTVTCRTDSMYEPLLHDLLKAITRATGADLAGLLGGASMEELAASRTKSPAMAILMGVPAARNGHRERAFADAR